jgi:hypothetical protein
VIVSGDIGGDTLPDFLIVNSDGTQIRVAINDTNNIQPTDTPSGFTPTAHRRRPPALSRVRAPPPRRP